MLTSSSIIQGAYFQDILAQPASLRALGDHLASFQLGEALRGNWAAKKFARVVLTGMGSSFHALYPLHRRLFAHGIVSHWMEAAELLLGFDALRREDTLLIAVSQSGESAEVVTLLKDAGKFGHVIGVANDPNSTLARGAGSVIPLHAGPESTVSCKTYVATLAALHWLGTALTGGNLNTALDEICQAKAAVQTYLASWKAHVEELLPFIKEVRNIFVTGRGDSLASASTGGLILKESTRLHAEGMSAAAFRHGPLEMADASVLVLIFEGDERVAPLHRRLADDIWRGGGQAALITSNGAGSGVFALPALAAAVQPMVEILSVQMLSLALAARGGFEAGRFQRASKITNIS